MEDSWTSGLSFQEYPTHPLLFPELEKLVEHGCEVAKNTPKIGIAHKDFVSQLLPLPYQTGTSHGGLCVVDRCVETTAVCCLVYIGVYEVLVRHFLT